MPRYGRRPDETPGAVEGRRMGVLRQSVLQDVRVIDHEGTYPNPTQAIRIDRPTSVGLFTTLGLAHSAFVVQISPLYSQHVIIVFCVQR